MASDRIGPSAREKILHACLTLEKRFAHGFCSARPRSGAPPKASRDGRRSPHPSPPEETEWIFAALSEGGNVTMPMAETFWAKRFGMSRDCFWISWGINRPKRQG